MVSSLPVTALPNYQENLKNNLLKFYFTFSSTAIECIPCVSLVIAMYYTKSS